MDLVAQVYEGGGISGEVVDVLSEFLLVMISVLMVTVIFVLSKSFVSVLPLGYFGVLCALMLVVFPHLVRLTLRLIVILANY